MSVIEIPFVVDGEFRFRQFWTPASEVEQQSRELKDIIAHAGEPFYIRIDSGARAGSILKIVKHDTTDYDSFVQSTSLAKAQRYHADLTEGFGKTVGGMFIQRSKDFYIAVARVSDWFDMVSDCGREFNSSSRAKGAKLLTDATLLLGYSGETILKFDKNWTKPKKEWSVKDRTGQTIKAGSNVVVSWAENANQGRGTVRQSTGKVIKIDQYKCVVLREYETGEEIRLTNCRPEEHMLLLDDGLLNRIMTMKLSNVSG